MSQIRNIIVHSVQGRVGPNYRCKFLVERAKGFLFLLLLSLFVHLNCVCVCVCVCVRGWGLRHVSLAYIPHLLSMECGME